MSIKLSIEESIKVKQAILNNSELLDTIETIAQISINAFENNGRLYLCGNGGSAADAQHIAAELSGRYKIDRDPLPAEALHVNSSFITAVANDYSFDVVYSRMVKAFGNENDILFAFSTSGNSKNIVNAVIEAKNNGMKTVGFTGQNQSSLTNICDYLISVPSTDTPRIQEAHILIGHIICDLIENGLFSVK